MILVKATVLLGLLSLVLPEKGEVNVEKFRLLKGTTEGPTIKIYLTFDDGPIDASLDVLGVLMKLKEVKATFFLNEFHLAS